MDENVWLYFAGAVAFGIVMGWITYRTLRHSTVTGLSDIATVVGAVAGAAVTGLFPAKTIPFSGYCIGLFIGFFAYFLSARDPKAPVWMGGSPTGWDSPGSGDRPGGGGGTGNGGPNFDH